jgi:hypothetical protein
MGGSFFQSFKDRLSRQAISFRRLRKPRHDRYFRNSGKIGGGDPEHFGLGILAVEPQQR